MNLAARKLAAFAGVLAAVLGGGAVAGAVLAPEPPGGKAETRGQPRDREVRRAEMNDMAGAAGGEHGSRGQDQAMRMNVRGLAIAENGMRLVIENPDLRPGQTRRLHFRIVDDHGRSVRAFDVAHTKRMHLIVVRRDLTGFQHLHPIMSPDGRWTTELRLPAPGSYRLFADFSRDGEPTTLAGDLRVDGKVELKAVPAPVPNQITGGGYDVALHRPAARAGQESELRFTVTQHGRPVPVEPYLGADGHLVALRDGDLAFLHVHPTEHPPGSDGRRNEQIRFAATFPTAGDYRLFLQFKHDGKVHTVAFTHRVS